MNNCVKLNKDLREAINKYNRSRNKEVKRKIFNHIISPLDIKIDTLRNG